jgi:hypothetical protein
MPVSRILLAALCGAVAFACPGWADVQNGDFSAITPHPDLPSPRGLTLWVGDPSLLHWTVASGPVHWLNFPHSQAHAVELPTGSALQQTVDTTPGVQYDLRFMLYSSYQPPTLKSVQVSNGAEQGDFADDSARQLPGAHTWVDETWTFTATSRQTTLTWTGSSATGAGPYVTDVLLLQHDAMPASELNLRREYARFVRALREQDAHAIFRPQSQSYVYRTWDGKTMERTDYNVSVEELMQQLQDVHLDLQSVRIDGMSATVVVAETVDLVVQGHIVHVSDTQEDRWQQTSAVWKLVSTQELTQPQER